MPFTFAHPAIVLPLRKSRHFHFPALVIGSMAPDFEYFIRLQAYSTYSHTLFGVLYFDLPLVLALWLLYTKIVEKPLVRCLPSWIGNRFGERQRHHSAQALRAWRPFLVFAYSAILGIMSHLIWDSFTHKGAFAVARLALLQHSLSLGGLALPVYKALQHGSTCIGLAAIAIVIWKSGRGIPEADKPSPVPMRVKGVYWLGVAAGGAGAACLFLIARKSTLTAASLAAGVVPFLSGALLALLLLSWLFSRYGLKK